ncbi:MAG: MAPEG family protein [Pseudomonadota bacterium]
MTVDLWMLLAAAGLYFLLSWGPAVRNIGRFGIFKLLGNRDAVPTSHDGAAARPDKALANMGEAMMVFTPLVLVAHVSGQADEMTARGAQIFVISRAAHAICYLMGAPVLRTIAYVGGLTGMGLIALRLLGVL